MPDTGQTKRMTVFKYEPPEIPAKRGKVSVNLVRTGQALVNFVESSTPSNTVPFDDDIDPPRLTGRGR